MESKNKLSCPKDSFKLKTKHVDSTRHEPPCGEYPFQIDKVQNKVLNYFNSLKQLEGGPSKLSYLESLALAELTAVRSKFILKKADKGNTIVIMDRSDYIKECLEQLEKSLHYKVVPSLKSSTCRDKIITVIKSLRDSNMITQGIYRNLLPPKEPKSRVFYLLPKIHKPTNKWSSMTQPPGRPIISNFLTESFPISQFLDFYLQPHMQELPTYVGDSLDFIYKLKSIKVDPTDYLITMDVSSLYTNIPHDLIRRVMSDIWAGNPDPINIHLATILDIILDHNDFQFNDVCYRQVCGVAMGNSVSPTLASIVFGHLEQEVMSKATHKPKLFLRFLDDLFIIWPHSLQSFNTLLASFNSQCCTIKLTETIDLYSTQFLDIDLFKGMNWLESGTLDTRVHFKPENSLALLHAESAHHKSTFRGILIGQLTRYSRLTSNVEHFNIAAAKLRKALIPRRYSVRLIDQETKRIRNKFYPLQSMDTKPCMKIKCSLCLYVAPPPLFFAMRHPTGLTMHTNCDSRWVVYLVWCNKCDSTFYVGHTSSLRQRILNHLSCIRMNKDNPVATHFNKHRSIPLSETFRFTVLDRPSECVKGPELLARSTYDLETKWIKQSKAIEKGLNTIDQYKRPIPFTAPLGRASTLIQQRISIFSDIWLGGGNAKVLQSPSSRSYLPKLIPHVPLIRNTISSTLVRSSLETLD